MRTLTLAGLVALALTPIAASAAAADSSNSAKVDALFSAWDNTRSPGCSVAVSRDHTIVHSRGYGMANLEYGVPIGRDTIFHVASVSKQFAAAAVMLLAEQGRVSLDDEARKYVPQLPDFGRSITIRHLIHHTSGLRDQWALLGFSGWRQSRDLITDDDVMSVVSRQRDLNFAPGERYSYSNTGYTLLGQIVRATAGKSLREFTTERFFTPLRMSSSHFRDDFTELVPNAAVGYERSGDGFRNSVTNFNTVGATSLLSTSEDLLKWAANLQTGEVGGERFARRMIEQGRLNDGSKIQYAAGLDVTNYRGLQLIGHSGADAGYRAYVGYLPAPRLAVALTCNTVIATSALAKQIADVYLAGQLDAVA
ncbi:MAG: beta-lactamase family protein, partial [Steroidobacter sp.]|nr:beta-lactamase family protein [Steroidobacter sp.]